MTYTVLGSMISPFVRKVGVFLAEKGIDYVHEDVNPFGPPEGFREISPLGRIPVLRHGDRVINDSSVICRYIENTNPDNPLYPSDPFDAARAEWIEEYSDGGLIPVAGNKIFRPLVLAPMMGGDAPDEVAINKAIDEDLPPFFDYLDSQIGESGYFVGDSTTIADIAVASGFVSLRIAGVMPDSGKWPKLAKFITQRHESDHLAGIIKPLVDFIGQRWV